MSGIDVILMVVQRASAREIVVINREVFHPGRIIISLAFQNDLSHIGRPGMPRPEMVCGLSERVQKVWWSDTWKRSSWT